MIKIALDAMGGDLGVDAVVSGADYYLSRFGSRDVFFNFYGDFEKIQSVLSGCRNISESLYSIHHVEKMISNDMKPSVAIRSGRNTSMFEAISSVSRLENDAVVSSGNTGAYMALSKIILKTLDNIERPALVSLIPNSVGKSVVLDLGANTECSSINLVQFAIMGQAVAKILLGKENPSVSLLNVGTEKSKGTDSLRGAFDILESFKNMNFTGFVEGTDIMKGTSDVIVTDGFSGNIALKTIEGTIKFLASMLKNEVKSGILGKIAYIFGKNIIKNIANAIDPKNHNGASLIGLQGIAVKSHGNSDHIGFANAISVAEKLARSKFIQNVKESLSVNELEKTNEQNKN